MDQTTVFGISRDAEVSALTKAELVALWKDVARHVAIPVLASLNKGAPPQCEVERKYQEVYNEMKNRKLLMT